MSDYVVSLIRTGVPVVVGAVLAWLAAKGLNVSPASQETVTGALTAVITFGYFAGVRAAEARWPGAGRLLGLARPPTYPPKQP